MVTNCSTRAEWYVWLLQLCSVLSRRSSRLPVSCLNRWTQNVRYVVDSMIIELLTLRKLCIPPRSNALLLLSRSIYTVCWVCSKRGGSNQCRTGAERTWRRLLCCHLTAYHDEQKTEGDRKRGGLGKTTEPSDLSNRNDCPSHLPLLFSFLWTLEHQELSEQ